MNSCHAFKYHNTPFQQRGSPFIKAVTTESLAIYGEDEWKRL